MNFWWLYVPQGTQKSFAEGFVSSFWGFSFSLARLIASHVLLFSFFSVAFRVTSAEIKRLKSFSWSNIFSHDEQFIALKWIAHSQKYSITDKTGPGKALDFLCSSYTACESGQCKIIKYSTVCNSCASPTMREKVLFYVFLKNLGRIVMWLCSWSTVQRAQCFHCLTWCHLNSGKSNVK